MREKLAILTASLIFGMVLSTAYAETVAVNNSPLKVSRVAASDPVGVLLERAKYWESRNRIDLAKEALEKLFNVAPDHPDGLAVMGLIEARAEHLDSARNILNKLRGVKPNHPAISRIEALIRLYGEDKNKLQQARQLAQQSRLPGYSGQTEKALAALRTLYPDGPPDGDLALEYWLLVANTKNDWKLAYDGIIRLVREYPSNERYRLELLEYLQLVANTKNDWKPAYDEISRLVREHPDNQYYRLALAALESHHYPRHHPINQKSLRIIIEIAKMPEFEKQAKGVWHSVLLGRYPSPEELPLLQEYLALYPDDSGIKERQQSIIQAKGALRYKMPAPQRPAKTETVSLMYTMDLVATKSLPDQALQAHPENAYVVGEMGLLRLRLEQTLREHPKDADVIGEMGMLRLRQGEHAQAHELFTQALHLTQGKSSKWQSLVKTSQFWQLMREASDARDAGDLTIAENKLHAARQLDSREPNAIAALAHIQADRGQFNEAESGYRQAISIDPLNSSALNGILSLYRQQGLEAKARQTIAQLSPAQRSALGAALDRMEADMLQEKADRMVAEGQYDGAITLLEQAVQMDADDPWLRFNLARQYARRNNAAKGQALFDDLLDRHPNDSDTLYALALYQSNQGDTNNALKTLNRVEPLQRSQKMVLLQKRLLVKNLVQNARLLVQSGQQNEAKQALSEADTVSSGDEDLTLTVAFEWAEIGDIQHSRALFDNVRTAHTPPSITWHLRYAEFLAMISSDQELQDELEAIADIKNLSLSEAAALAELQESAAIRMADKQILAGNATLAHQTLSPFLKNKPDQVRLLLADARAYRAERQWLLAQANYTHILQINQSDREARSGLIETLISSGNRGIALKHLDEWAADSAANDLNTRLYLCGLFIDLEEYARAQNMIDTLLVSHPDHSRVLNYAWQVAHHAGRLDKEIDYLKKSLAAEQAERNSSGRSSAAPALQGEVAQMPNSTLAYQNVGIGEFGDPKKIERNWKEKKLAALIDRRSDWLSSAIDIHSRSGKPGLSQLNSTEITLEYKIPWHANDEIFFRADLVKLDAGSVDPTNTQFGILLGCQKLCVSPLSENTLPGGGLTPQGEQMRQRAGWLAQSAQGVGFTAGYQRDDLSADLGFTPLNFPVSNVVGGMRKKGDFGQYGYSIEASRRPVISSLLSFAGTRDPFTGGTWGGVVATGGRAGLNFDEGRTFGFWSSVGLHSLTGRYVLSNSRFQFMAGGQWRIVNEENRLFSFGLTGMYWHHTQNAGEYTAGHGGYFSPLNYHSLSLPITYAKRTSRFSFMLSGAVSVSESQTRSALYYPTLPLIQAHAVALTPTNFITPVYAGGSGHGTGYSLKVASEYQFDPKLFVGGQLSVDRSESYAPNRMLFYMRYSLDHPAALPVFMPPEPIEPSSKF